MDFDSPMDTQYVGIKAIGYYLPGGVMTGHDMAELSGIPASVFVEEIGIVQKPVAGADEHPSEMGVRAALDAIGKAGVPPSAIDLIAYCGAGDYDYRFWSPAAKIQMPSAPAALSPSKSETSATAATSAFIYAEICY